MTHLTAFSILAKAQTEYSVFTSAGRRVDATFITDYQAFGIIHKILELNERIIPSM